MVRGIYGNLPPFLTQTTNQNIHTIQNGANGTV
jgi:hypothetical protein